MVKSVGKRFLSIALVIVMVLTLLPVIEMSASAANVNTGVTGLTAESSGNASWSGGSGAITGTATTSSSTSCGTTTYTPQSGTLTITNSSGQKALVTFDYNPVANGGSITIDDAAAPGGSFNKILEANGTIVVSIKSSEAAANTSTITISNLKLTEEKSVTLTLKVPTNGSYKVDGTAVTAQTTKTVLTTDSVTLAATPASGYKLLGWYNETTGSYFANTASVTTSFTENATIEPKFVPNGSPVFQVGSRNFTDLNEAVSYATSSGNATITLISSGTLPAGNYTIPSGKTLLIPFDEAYTMYTTVPGAINGGERSAPTAPSAYVTLTMANGAKLNVSGAVSVSAMVNANNTNYSGVTSAKYGYVSMSAGSEMTFNSGSNLYAWGYISGNGNIQVKSGATVYEPFQVGDLRGGTASSTLALGKRVFPFSQYFVQNVEAPMTFAYGANEYVVPSVNIAGLMQPAVHFIGSSGAMFIMSSGSTFKKSYSPTEDRVTYAVTGNASINSISMSIGVTIDSGDFTLPLMENLNIDILSGKTTINQNALLIPGVKATVSNGATLEISRGKSVYVFDQDQWVGKKYVYSSTDFKASYYSPTRKAADKFTSADLIDVLVDVNGVVNALGNFYTTEGGANICSTEGTGVVQFPNGASADSAVEQYIQSDSKYDSIAVTSAKLHNGENRPEGKAEYTTTAGELSSTTFTYCALHDMWEKDATGKTVTFKANEGTGSMDPQTTCPAGGVTLAANTFTREGYDFTGWNTAADGSGTAYADGASITVDADTTLYAQWKVKTFTVKWLNLDGTELKAMADVPYGTTVNASAFDGDAPTMPDDEYAYTFDGWSADSAVITEDTYFVAQYDKQALEYTVDLYFHVDGIDDELGGTVTLAANKSMKLTATPTYKTGGVTYYFDHWEFGVDDNTKLVYPAMSVTIRPSQAGRFTAYAVYSTTEKTDFEPFVMIIRDKMVGTKLVKTLTYSLTDDFTLVPGSVGFTVENADGQVIGSAFSQNLKGKTGTYTVTVANATEAVKVIAHITYQDANGAEFTKTAQ